MAVDKPDRAKDKDGGRSTWTTREISLEIQDAVATVTLDRPDRLNAFTRRMAAEVIDAFDRTDTDDSVRAVIVTGRGRAFCAGADLGGGEATFSYEPTNDDLAPRDVGGLVTLRIFSSTKPVIAAINGPAVGLGATMTLPMDFRLASRDARMGFVFTARGIVPDGACSWFLPRIVGINQALDWCLTARVFGAGEALDAGLLRTLYETQEDLLAAAHDLAQEVATKTAPVSANITRQLLWRMLGAPHPMEAHRVDSLVIAQLGRLADAREGITSFFEKRPPQWKLAANADTPDWWPWWVEPTYESQ